MNNWGKSVKTEMLIPRKAEEQKSFCLRNAYQMNLERDYNSGKSPRHPKWMKMYAELKLKKKLKKLGIKSLSDNRLDATFLVADKMDHNLCFWWRQRPEISTSADFKTGVLLTKMLARFVAGFSDWRGIQCNAGA